MASLIFTLIIMLLGIFCGASIVNHDYAEHYCKSLNQKLASIESGGVVWCERDNVRTRYKMPGY